MKNKFILLCSTLCIMGVNAQNQDSSNLANDTISPWTTKGNASFLFNQSTFDNWLAGGENNISGNAGLNYDFNYKKDDWSWDNKFIASYGIVKTKTSSFAKKTDDRIEVNSVLGKKITERWYYSAFLNFKTQFTKGYNYSRDDNGAEIREEYTNFLSPGYLLIGPGLMYKKDDNFKFNLSPATSKFTFVDKNYTLPDEAYFGVKEGESVRYELGFNASAYYKLDIIANVTFENIVNLYSNYLEDPQNVDLDYQLNIVMKINRYLTTNLSFQTIYDDNAYQGFQLRQVFGVAANYGF
ncbi:DUF3078 domain-containing protein [Flavobacterium salilacus subsp. salilacus]|uniref:DUF3078 domain-containing protein n=1 Tax=Flavobacterium TaxID=237 RepID=UPI00107525B4|nr:MULTISPECIES: DUF3078 domain-containing protein [Flavobacterium]KAF2519059.1 DUF3078 domain-containing protein [Flavobacterium salilacus subsp. salilacus]MBE1614775.1 DUF3078 domain-containing protein [Flavobacterium sp. SaA2.13]